MGHESFNFLKAHSFPDSPLHANQSHTILIFNQLANSPDTTITKMINIINWSLRILQAKKIFHSAHNIFMGKSSCLYAGIETKFGIYLKTANL